MTGLRSVQMAMCIHKLRENECDYSAPRHAQRKKFAAFYLEYDISIIPAVRAGVTKIRPLWETTFNQNWNMYKLREKCAHLLYTYVGPYV